MCMVRDKMIYFEGKFVFSNVNYIKPGVNKNIPKE